MVIMLVLILWVGYIIHLVFKKNRCLTIFYTEEAFLIKFVFLVFLVNIILFYHQSINLSYYSLYM